MANEDFRGYKSGGQRARDAEKRFGGVAIASAFSDATGYDVRPAVRTVSEFVYTPPSTILPQNSRDTAWVHSNKIRPDGKYTKENCPWVEIRGPNSAAMMCPRGDAHDRLLYASVTITGCTSWEPLVRRLAAKGRRDFLILSGRHGNLPNLWNPRTRLTNLETFDGPKDQGYSGDNFFEGDTAVMNKLIEESRGTSLQGINVEVWDTANLPLQNERGEFTMNRRADTKYNQVGHLHRVIARALSQGTVVIMAWCFSLHTFTQEDEAIKQTAKHGRMETYLMRRKTIADTVREQFQFVTDPSFKGGNRPSPNW